MAKVEEHFLVPLAAFSRLWLKIEMLLLIPLVFFPNHSDAQNLKSEDSVPNPNLIKYKIELAIDGKDLPINYDSLKIALITATHTLCPLAITDDTLRISDMDSFQLWISYGEWQFQLPMFRRSNRNNVHLLRLGLYTREGFRNYVIEENDGKPFRGLKRMKHLKQVIVGIDNFSVEALGRVHQRWIGPRREVNYYLRWYRRRFAH